MAPRYAGTVLPALESLFKYLIPSGRNRAANLMLRYGPELAYSGYAMALAPEGTSFGQRLGIGAEDLAIGLGSSIGGQVVGGLGGRAREVNRLRKLGILKKGQTLDQYRPDTGRFPVEGFTEKVSGLDAKKMMLDPYITGGDVTGSIIGNMLLPRRKLNEAYEQAALRQDPNAAPTDDLAMLLAQMQTGPSMAMAPYGIPNYVGMMGGR
tara:strand:- start:1005 stop:1631 length:627 start_codon:yes stop_codon:yes gene_type:complete